MKSIFGGNKRKTLGEKTWSLFWVTDDEHHEDWFIVARSKIQAERYYVSMEGMTRNDHWVRAEYIMSYKNFPGEQVDYPTLEQLESLGFTILNDTQPTTVRFSQRIFVEGKLQSMIDEMNQLNSLTMNFTNSQETQNQRYIQR